MTQEEILEAQIALFDRRIALIDKRIAEIDKDIRMCDWVLIALALPLIVALVFALAFFIF